MNDLIFEPYAARLHWRFTQPLIGAEWGALFAEYVEALARCSAQLAPIVVGHIKGIAIAPSGGYVRVNLTRSSAPADVESTLPDRRADLSLDLNVLIYGLPFDEINVVAQETAAQVAAARDGCVHIELIHTEHSPS